MLAVSVPLQSQAKSNGSKDNGNRAPAAPFGLLLTDFAV